MKKLVLLFTLISTISFHSIAQDQKQDSIDELFEVMQADKMIDSIYGQMSAMFDNMQQQMGIQQDELPIYEKYNQQMIKVMQKEMSWEKMKPELRALYLQNFTEAEVQGILDFYKSPVGQSMLEKMPAITQQSMALGQQLAMNAMPALQEVSEKLQAELKEYRAQNATQN